MSAPLRGALTAGLLLVVPAAADEPALRSAVVEIGIEGWDDGAARHHPAAPGLPKRLPAEVEITYELEAGGDTRVPFLALAIAGVRPARIRAFLEPQGAAAERRELPFHVEPGSGSLLRGDALLPPGLPSGPVRLRLTYEAAGAVEIDGRTADLRLPLLVCRWPPREARPGTFVATVALPADLHLLEAFPSDYHELAADELPAAAPPPGRRYRFELAVVPSLLRLHAVRGARPWLTAERAVDTATVAVLLGLGWIGLRRFRRLLG